MQGRFTSEETYTLAEAREIIKTERQEKRQETVYKIKQKMLGLMGIGVSVLSPILLDGDTTISILMFPLGIYLIFTRKKVMM